MAIWALVTGSDGEKVLAVVPRVIPRAEMQLTSSAWSESAGMSAKGMAPEVGQARPSAFHIPARIVAMWTLVTASDGEKVPAVVPAVAPKADAQAMPAAWVESEATSSKSADPEVGHSRPVAIQVRVVNVAIWALVTGSDGEKVVAVVPTVILSLVIVSMLLA